MLRSTVESVRSRCQRDTGSFSARCRRSALASPRLPSEFSKSIGLTLCGIVDEPTSPSRHLLPEVAERHVAPDVAIEVDQHRVGARDRVEELGHVVVRLDLRRVRIELEAQTVDDLGREPFPVDVGVGDDVRVVVADRAVHLALDRHPLDRRRSRARAARRRSPFPCRAWSASPAGRACARASAGPRARARARADRPRCRAARAAGSSGAPRRASARARGC